MLPGQFTPQLQNWLVRLAVWMPFAQAAALFSAMLGTPVSAATVQRLTSAAGATALAAQQVETAHLIQAMPLPTVTPATQVISVDGAMVPLRGGVWAEVKTLVIGTVAPQMGDAPVRSAELSYFSRLDDAATFTQAATWELHRRGVERAQQVVAVTDGAEWIQGFLDQQCPDAVRILDFPHASQRLTPISEAHFGAGSAAAQEWQQDHRRLLKAQGGAALLIAVADLQANLADPTVIAPDVAYLTRRVEQMAYGDFQAAGGPIGSGMVESANKLVVEARLKGSGMHWTRANVNGMLVLRNAVCNDRWDEQWAVVATLHAGQACGSQRPCIRPSPPTATPPAHVAGTLSRPSLPDSADAIARVQAELANERANSVWWKPFSRKQQRAVADAREAH